MSASLPEGKWLLDGIDTTADYVNNGVLVEVSFLKNVIWKKMLPFSRDMVERTMMDDELETAITTTMRAHLNLKSQAHLARLNMLFPNSIHSVEFHYDPNANVKLIVVKFRNGHVARGPEHEAKSELFHARCAMLYDLPPI